MGKVAMVAVAAMVEVAATKEVTGAPPLSRPDPENSFWCQACFVHQTWFAFFFLLPKLPNFLSFFPLAPTTTSLLKCTLEGEERRAS